MTEPRTPSQLPLARWVERRHRPEVGPALAELRPHRRWTRRILAAPARLGSIALVSVGIHAGADRLDDHLLFVLDRLDLAFDAVVTRSLGSVGRLMASALEWSELATLATGGAFVLELAALLVLSVALIAWPKETIFAGPLRPGPRAVAVAMAAVAGCAVVAREVQVGLHVAARAAGADAIATGAGQLGGAAALLATFFLLAVPATVAVLAQPRWRRGLELAAVVAALPPAALAFFGGGGIVSTALGLLP